MSSDVRLLDYCEGLKLINQRLTLDVEKLKSDGDEFKPKNESGCVHYVCVYVYVHVHYVLYIIKNLLKMAPCITQCDFYIFYCF